MFQIFKKKFQGQQVVYKIKGMHCTSCAMNINGALEDTKGVLNSETSFASSQVKISFDPKLIDESKLITVISEQGYQVVT